MPTLDRRSLSRALTKASRAATIDVIREGLAPGDQAAYRVGITGPPGAGKSTLVSQLAATRVSDETLIGILAIDPSSPISGGAILGDRIRMDEITDSPQLYIRSFSSGALQDGLTANVPGLLAVMDDFGFSEVFIETVGVGQINHAIHVMADTVVLVLVPESGDAIQAMKAGILEIADIYVINKADRPGAAQIRSELEGVLQLSKKTTDDWQPPVVMTAARKGDVGALNEAINEHQQWLREHVDRQARTRQLRRYLATSLLEQRISEIARTQPDATFDGEVADVIRTLLAGLDV